MMGLTDPGVAERTIWSATQPLRARRWLILVAPLVSPGSGAIAPGQQQARRKPVPRLPYAAPAIPLSTDLGRRFLYARYNADLSSQGLGRMGFSGLEPASIQKMDAVENIEPLLAIGRAAGENVQAAHFGPFI